MNAIDVLRAEVGQARQEREEAKERTKLQAVIRMEDEWRRYLGDGLVQELQARVDNDGIILTYRGRTMRLTTIRQSKELIVDWMERIDAWYEMREKQHETFLLELASCNEVTGWLQSRIGEWKLQDDEEIVVAMAAAAERIAVAEDNREHQARAEREAELCQMVAHLEQIWEFPLPELPWNLDGEPVVMLAYECAYKRAEARAQEREARRADLEAEAFEAFCYYRVYYGLIAEAEGDRWVEWDRLNSLSDTCDEDGWWRSAQPFDPPVRLAHVFKVERVEVRELREMPSWCPTRQTEFGQIRMCPEGAERL